jgi:Flp pilus assembly pilin Flp
MACMRKSAQSLIEYGLILALVAVIAVTVLSKFGKTLTNAANRTDTTVNQVSNGAATSYCASIGSSVNTTTGACE